MTVLDKLLLIGNLCSVVCGIALGLYAISALSMIACLGCVYLHD